MAYQYLNYQNPSRSCCTPYKSVVVWSCVSAVICITVLALSLLDLGRASFGLNISLPILTLAYHSCIFFAHRRFQDAINNGTISENAYHPMATTKALVIVYALLVLWIVPTVVVNAMSIKSDHNAVFANFFHATLATRIAQMSLDSTEVGLLTSIALTCTYLRMTTDHLIKARAAGQLPSTKC